MGEQSQGFIPEGRVHQNARTTPASRAELVARVLDDQLPVSVVAVAAGVCPRTGRKWVARYQAEGPEGLADRSSRPHHQPPATPAHIVSRITALRRQRQMGVQIVRTVGVSPATVSRVLRRAGLHRLDALERAPPVRRYERKHPGELLHLDVKKLARFQQPGHRVTGNRRQCTPRAGWDYVHVCIDDHLPRRLGPHLSRRDRRQCHRLPLSRRRLLPPPGCAGHGGDDRQRRRLPLATLRQLLPTPQTAPSLHAAPYAPHQRKGGTLHSNRPPRMGLRPRVPNVTPARRSPDALAASIQLASTTWQPQPSASH